MLYRAYAPASSANLSVAFDLLGIALKRIDNEPLGDFVSVRELKADEKGNVEPRLNISVGGSFVHKLPTNHQDNIVYTAYEQYKKILSKDGLTIKALDINLSKNLPVCSGLGSSASSVVAAVMALDAIHDNYLGDQKRVELMGFLEGQISQSIHYDNVAPCYYGGMQFITDECGIISQSVPYFKNWYWVMCFPGIKVSTAEARSILPAQYLRQDVISFGRRIGAFMQACYTQNEQLAQACLVDVIAEPYRASLIPGFKEARVFANCYSALATGISGSGSTIFSIFNNLEQAQIMKQYLEREFIQNEDGFCHICQIDDLGARVEVLAN